MGKHKSIIQPIQSTPLELPLFESVTAGFPSPAEDYMDTKLDLNKYCIRNAASTFFIRVEGESMHNAGIYDGDILIVDRSLHARHNDIIVAVVDGEFLVKRFCTQGRTAFLAAENTGFPPIIIDENTDFVVWGVVTNTIHKVSSRS
jgi:DNA polymerase V